MVSNERGQSLISKYVWVIETILQAGKISFEELNRKWLRNTEISRGMEIPKRTFDHWKMAIADIWGLYIENEGKGEYRYFIMNEKEIRENGLRSWLYNAFCVNNALVSSQSIKDRILLEYVPSGQYYLQSIIDAMKENRVLNITYHDYNKNEENSFDVHPYCVKLFRQRWYLVARRTNTYYYNKEPFVYMLDCIKDLQAKDETFEMPKNWSADLFFDGYFGIGADRRIDKQLVKLKVSAGRANYIRDLPMHASQEEVYCNDEYSIFSYFLCPEFEFQQELLWNGEDIEVLEPAWLRKEIAGKILRMGNKYIEDENKINDWGKRKQRKKRFIPTEQRNLPTGLKDFAAIDFETANFERSSICSVGIVIVRDDEIVDSFYSLIHPEPNYYNNICSQIYGLCQHDTDNAPIFPKVWVQIEPLIEGLPLVAHNKSFEEGCLKAVFRAYQMEYPDYEFYDTLIASKQKLPELPNHTLLTVAAACGYQFDDHYNALSDAEACAWVARKMFE
jgi:inhibitor of KinA sporulation pathway (predicted exonuclease)